jgi:hypothetical protein
VLQLTGSGVALGMVYALMYLPMLLVGSRSGAIGSSPAMGRALRSVAPAERASAAGART